MKKRWINIIGSGVLVMGFALAGTGFAESDESEVANGTIRIENQVEADFPALTKITWGQAVLGSHYCSDPFRIAPLDSLLTPGVKTAVHIS